MSTRVIRMTLRERINMMPVVTKVPTEDDSLELQGTKRQRKQNSEQAQRPLKD